MKQVESAHVVERTQVVYIHELPELLPAEMDADFRTN
jgi:hypothetical protein